MSFLRAARAALVGQTCFSWMLTGVVIVLAGVSLSCVNNESVSASKANHSAFVTLPADGSVLLLNINGATGTVSVGPKTPPTQNITPRGLALHPSKKFLYVANARANTISIFNVGAAGILTLGGTTPAGNGPTSAVIDPTGTYLLVTNVFGSNASGGDISVYTMDAGSGALTEVAGSPFPANASPTAIQFTNSGSFVYVTNTNIGMVTGFSFSSSTGALSQVPGSPIVSGAGAAALAVDASDEFLYVANPSATNLSPYSSTVGNISGFTINSTTGALTLMQGSPFAATNCNGPTALTVAPGGFIYAVTPGTSYSIWCFSITHGTGQLVSVANSPFSLSAGGLFAVIDPIGNFLYTGSQSGNGISAYTYDLSTGAPTIIGGAPFSTGSAPGAMVFLE
jgi:6-phosphogluconolactonase